MTSDAYDDDEAAPPAGIYVYGIVPADVKPEDDATGIHDAPIEIVTHGDIAALVSEIDPNQRLGTPADLRAHAQILDGTSLVAPVLPLRFGAVVSDRDAVINELLADHDDEFASSLAELEGCAQYLVKGRYVQETILREIVDENPKATALLESIRSQPEELTRDARMALGEIIGHTLDVKRDADTRTTLDALSPVTDTVTVREPTHDEDAVQIAVLLRGRPARRTRTGHWAAGSRVGWAGGDATARTARSLRLRGDTEAGGLTDGTAVVHLHAAASTGEGCDLAGGIDPAASRAGDARSGGDSACPRGAGGGPRCGRDHRGRGASGATGAHRPDDGITVDPHARVRE